MDQPFFGIFPTGQLCLVAFKKKKKKASFSAINHAY